MKNYFKAAFVIQQYKESGDWLLNKSGGDIIISKILKEKGDKMVTDILRKHRNLIDKFNIKPYTWEYQCFEDSDTKFFHSWNSRYFIIPFKNNISIYMFCFPWLKESQIGNIISGRITDVTGSSLIPSTVMHRNEIERFLDFLN